LSHAYLGAPGVHNRADSWCAAKKNLAAYNAFSKAKHVSEKKPTREVRD
jgi:hypothetical protein